MLKGFTEKKELKNVTVTPKGAILVSLNGSDKEEGSADIPITDNSTTILSTVIIVSTTDTEIPLNKKIKSIMIANCSDEQTVIINAGKEDLQVAANVAVELPLNYDVKTLNIRATGEDVKVQICIKGEA